MIEVSPIRRALRLEVQHCFRYVTSSTEETEHSLKAGYKSGSDWASLEAVLGQAKGPN